MVNILLIRIQFQWIYWKCFAFYKSGVRGNTVGSCHYYISFFGDSLLSLNRGWLVITSALLTLVSLESN